MSRPRLRAALAAATLALLIAGCASPPGGQSPAGPRPPETRALIDRLLPANVPERAGWATDIQAAFSALEIVPTAANLCAVMAVTEQESSWRADPEVPGLAAIAWREIDRQAERAGVPALLVRGALQLSSSDGRSYADRIDAARTERQLSAVFEDLIDRVPLGRRLLASRNPVRTGGPMQVSIAFAQAQAESRPYPYPMSGSVRDEVFSRRGGLYFGIAHLLGYEAPYAEPIYRFADFNAGRYASRNAAFQNAVSLASAIPLDLDGDLLPAVEAADGRPGSTELAVDVLARPLDMSKAAIRRDLQRGNEADFDRSRLYERVFALAERQEGKPLPRAVLPRITLKSPKITRTLTTEWFARRVDERYRRCLARGQGPGPQTSGPR